MNNQVKKKYLVCKCCEDPIKNPHARLYLHVYNDLEYDAYFCCDYCLIMGLQHLLNTAYDVIGYDPDYNGELKGGED